MNLICFALLVSAAHAGAGAFTENPNGVSGPEGFVPVRINPTRGLAFIGGPSNLPSGFGATSRNPFKFQTGQGNGGGGFGNGGGVFEALQDSGKETDAFPAQVGGQNPEESDHHGQEQALPNQQEASVSGDLSEGQPGQTRPSQGSPVEPPPDGSTPPGDIAAPSVPQEYGGGSPVDGGESPPDEGGQESVGGDESNAGSGGGGGGSSGDNGGSSSSGGGGQESNMGGSNSGSGSQGGGPDSNGWEQPGHTGGGGTGGGGSNSGQIQDGSRAYSAPPGPQGPSGSVRGQGGSGRHPYIVSLRKEGSGHYCAGVLVASQFVATAAQCVDSGSSSHAYDKPTLYIGGVSREQPVEIRQTAGLTFHPKWKRDKYGGYDVALIKLDSSVGLKPIRFPKQETGLSDDEWLKGIGWGRSSENGPFADVLQEVTVPYIKPEACSKFTELGSNSNFLCAGGQGADMCNGDEGSPLFRDGGSPSNDLLLGIASFREATCGDMGVPGMYTRVDRIGQWMSDNVF